MKLTELSFADMAALEIMPAVAARISFFGPHGPADAARFAYEHADALAKERDRRNDIYNHEIETLTRRAETAERTVEILQLRLAVAEELSHD